MRQTTIEMLDVVLELTGTPVDVRLTEPIADIVDCTCCSLSVVDFRADEVVRLTGGS